MTRQLSDADIGGAIAELSRAVAQLAQEAGVPTATRQTALSDAQELEVQRLQLSHPGILRQEVAAYPEGDFRESSATEEILRLTATFPREFGASRSGGTTRSGGTSRSGGARPGARARRDSDLVALSRTTASPADGQLVSKWGLPVTVAGVPVTTENSQRLGLGRVLPPLVVESDPDDFEDISHLVGNPTGGLGVAPDSAPDLGATDPGFGKQTMEVSNPGAVADPAAEVNRLVAEHGSAVAGLRPAATKNRHPQTGRFTSKQARLTGTLSGV